VVGALWELRSELGAQVADVLADKCRAYINGQSKFADALKAILKVDDAKFGGAHKDKIVSIFAKRGIVANVHRAQGLSPKRRSPPSS